MSKIGISAIEIELPETKMTVNEMAYHLGEDAEQLVKELGVSRKPVLAAGQDIVVLACKAVDRLLQNNILSKDKIGLILYASCGVSEKQLWSPAAKVQKEMRIKDAFAFDIQNGCNAGNVAMEIARNLLMADDKKEAALIIVADSLSQIVDYTNPQHKCIFNFSDAASAVLLEKNATGNHLLSFSASTEAIFADSMYKSIADKYVWLNDDSKEDQALIVEYEKRYELMIKSALGKINKGINNLNHIIMNQGDHKLITKLAKKLAMQKDKIFRSHNEFGHLGGTDIFFGLKQVLAAQQVKKNDLVVLASSAIGFSWGASVIQI